MSSDVVAGLLIMGGSLVLVLLQGLPPVGSISGNVITFFWPSVLLFILATLGAGLSLKAFLSNTSGQDPIHKPALSRARTAMTFLLILSYVLALSVFGFYFAGILFVVLGSRLMGSRSWLQSLVFSLVLVGTLWAILDRLLGVPLPEKAIGL